MIPLGAGQRLCDIPDTQYYVHIVGPIGLGSPVSSDDTDESGPVIPKLVSHKRSRPSSASDDPSKGSATASSLPYGLGSSAGGPGRPYTLPLNPPLFVFSSPSSVERLPLFTELRDMVELGVVASLGHFVVDATFNDLRRSLETLRPGGIHIAAHVVPPDELHLEPRFIFRAEGSSNSVVSAAAGSNGTAPSQHVTVSFSELVDLLRPFGVLKPDGFIEYVFVNACSSESLLKELTAQCGVPFAIGWSTKAMDIGCSAFVRGERRAALVLRCCLSCYHPVLWLCCRRIASTRA